MAALRMFRDEAAGRHGGPREYSMKESMSYSFDLEGLIDLHIHTAPDVRPRSGDDLHIARTAAEAGMRAILIKSHVTLTADRAAIAQKVVGGICVFGGLALNAPVGGINPAAVETALKLGAMEIWMPTMDAASHLRSEGKGGGISLFTEDGRIHSTVHEVVELVRQADAILGTGHLSVEESRALVQLARGRGVQKILVNHPEASFIQMPVAVQRELAGEGVFFERCCNETTPHRRCFTTIEEIAHTIREVGIQSTVLATDFGQAVNPSPVDGMRSFLLGLSESGFGMDELRTMAGDNPAYLLGI